MECTYSVDEHFRSPAGGTGAQFVGGETDPIEEHTLLGGETDPIGLAPMVKKGVAFSLPTQGRQAEGPIPLRPCAGGEGS